MSSTKFAALLSIKDKEPKTWKRPNFIAKMRNYKSRRDKTSEVDLMDYTKPMTQYLSSLCDQNVVMILQQNVLSNDYSCIDRNGNVVKRSKTEIGEMILENYKCCGALSLYDQFHQLAKQLQQRKNVNQEIKKCKECKCIILEECNWGCNNIYEPQQKKRRIV